MKQAVFFDIDGTLWDDKMQIPKSTQEALKRLHENGHYAFLCSGRSRSTIRSQRLLDLGFDGIVAACGAHVELQGKVVFQKLLSRELVSHLVNALDAQQLFALLEGPQYIYVDEESFHDDPYVIHLRQELGGYLRPIHGNEEIVMNKLSLLAEQDRLERLMEELGAEFEAICHEGNIVEINQRGYSKATGIGKVCEMLDIPRDRTYAFGDSANDVDMLRCVAHGVAMGNAVLAAKQSAEYVTAAIGEDGIFKGLKHYGLI